MVPSLFGIDYYLVSPDRLIKALQSLPSGCSVCGSPMTGALSIYFCGHQVGTIEIRNESITVEYQAVEFTDDRDGSTHKLEEVNQEF